MEESGEELAERARAGTRRGWIKGVIFAGTQAVIINETDGTARRISSHSVLSSSRLPRL